MTMNSVFPHQTGARASKRDRRQVGDVERRAARSCGLRRVAGRAGRSSGGSVDRLRVVRRPEPAAEDEEDQRRADRDGDRVEDRSR